MLKNRWPNPACKNMYETSVHGCTGMYAGSRMKSTSTASKPGMNCCAKKIATLAKRIRLTQGVSIGFLRGSKADRSSVDPPLDRTVLNFVPFALVSHDLHLRAAEHAP